MRCCASLISLLIFPFRAYNNLFKQCFQIDVEFGHNILISFPYIFSHSILQLNKTYIQLQLPRGKKWFGKNGKKKTPKQLLEFIIFTMLLLGINQIVFFFFQPTNLYQQIQIPRSMSLGEIKLHGNKLKMEILSKNLQMKLKQAAIKRLQQVTNILSHPARRATYDTFCLTDTQYAWAFKNQKFLISAVIGSSFFYIFSLFMNIMNRTNDEAKQAFKFQVIIIFLVFIWEIQVIMKTQNRLFNPSDSLDYIYNSFPIFERRDMVKILLFPFCNLFRFFMQYYIVNESQLKLKNIGKHPTLELKTRNVRHHLESINQKNQHLEDRISVGLSEIRKSHPLETDVFELQRQLIIRLVQLEYQNILYDQQVQQIMKNFLLHLQKK